MGRAGRPALGEVGTHETRNGYDFALDSAKRTRLVTGTLRLADAKRSQASQRNAGKPDRLSTDHDGHCIARRFDGPTEAFNHFTQDGNFNRGAYKSMENVWANDVRAGHKITVSITPTYQGQSKRPSSIDVNYFVDGARRRQSFKNSPGG
ncbi:DNA/RNA non-specific endonuclease [Sphingomonas sp.]|uniref:DNA/RNA non-specific endonuclease n=1 Tax=Sphingomonas sp. TaxID=28214 RepID=UPI0025FC0CAA|nr:DNA/RNA non-specific endonuclease [Sphingomonas sp.]